MKLIVGLGNPGFAYALSRHNMGFQVVDILSRCKGIRFGNFIGDACYGQGLVAGIPVILAKPQTFMNLSGYAVQVLIERFAVPVSDLIVIYDDLDLPVGAIRIRVGGGDGGHKGIRSIIDHIGDPGFIRIRVGIGKPERKELTQEYVLSPLTVGEREEMGKVMEWACEAVVEIVSSDAQTAMTRFNRKIKTVTIN